MRRLIVSVLGLALLSGCCIGERIGKVIGKAIGEAIARGMGEAILMAEVAGGLEFTEPNPLLEGPVFWWDAPRWVAWRVARFMMVDLGIFPFPADMRAAQMERTVRWMNWFFWSRLWALNPADERA